MDEKSQIPQQPEVQPTQNSGTATTPSAQPLASGTPPTGSLPTNNAQTAASSSQSAPPPKTPSIQKVEQIIFLLLGFVEIVLVIRMLLVLLGANPDSGFVSLILRITSPFSAPFKGVFGAAAEEGIIEPSVIIAMIVYALLAVGLAKLARVILTKDN